MLMVNAYREPGMQRYWIPSNPDSAVFGTKIADRNFLAKVGGDLAFVNAVQKVLIERGWVKHEFLNAAVAGYEELKASLNAQSMDDLLAQCGLPLPEVEAFPKVIANADTIILPSNVADVASMITTAMQVVNQRKV